MATLPKSKGAKGLKAATKPSEMDDDIKSSFDERDATSDDLDGDVSFDDMDDILATSDDGGAESDGFFADTPYTGTVEGDGKPEANALLKGFKDRAKREATRMADAVDDEYWVAVIFQTRAQKEAWLTALGVIQDGDKYIDGLPVARAMGIKLPAASAPQTKFRSSGKFEKLSMPI